MTAYGFPDRYLRLTARRSPSNGSPHRRQVRRMY